MRSIHHGLSHRRAAAAFVVGACLLLADPARADLAPFVSLAPITDDNPATNDNGWANVEINATAFKNQSLVTVGDYQFTSYYGADQQLILARRNLVAAPNEWFLLRTGETSANINDSHNVSTIGIDGAGRLHVAWGVHGNPLRYMRTTGSVLNDAPFTVPGNTASQIPLQSSSVTYPEFWNMPGTSDMLLSYRTGSSGNGEYQLARWNNAAGSWGSVRTALNSNDGSAAQPWIDNDFSGDSNVDANAYLNGLQYDSTGRLHVTWTWRSGTNPSGFNDYQSNHNIMYAYSDNGGADWRLQNGSLLQRDPTGAPPVTHDVDEANATPVINLPFGSSLINQASSAIGPNDHLYVSTWYAPDAAALDHTRQYMLLEYDGSTWQQHQVGVRSAENGGNRVPESQLGAFRMSRPIVMTDEVNRVFVVYSDHQRQQGVTVAYSQSAARDDWQFIDLATNDDMQLWEPKYDLTRWQRDGVLSMLYQPAGQGPSSAPVSVLEWNARAFFHGGLVLNVNRTTGAITISNGSDNAVDLDGYSIASADGQLAPAAWNSLANQGVAGWAEAQASATALAESSSAPLSIASSAAAALGRPYVGQPTAFRVDAPGDLAFRFTVGGQEIQGAVTYSGASLNNLTLLVDPETGEAQLRNTSPFSVAIDGYTISSVSSSLSPTGWSSLDDQNAAGGDWIESNVNDSALSELKPTASTLLAGGDSYNLGHLYDAAGGSPDVEFRFLIAGDIDLTPGVVLFTPVTPTADFNDDGTVDGADLLAWQRGFGKTIHAGRADGDADHDGDVDGDDLAVWRTGFAASAAVTAQVPETGAGLLAIVAAAALFAQCRRRR